MSKDFDIEKYRTIGHLSRKGQTERVVERADGATVIHDEHWDGRVDATARPDVIRHGIKLHRGKGKVEAEVTKMTPKERRERYGDEG